MIPPEQLLAFIRDKVDHPATVKELLQRLKMPRDERAGLKRQLLALVASGDLVEIRGHRFGLPDHMNLVVGRVQTHPRGFGFVVPERPPDGVDGDVFIEGANLNQAMHGDRVVARIERRRAGDRAEGRIVRILERGAVRAVGRYDIDRSGLGFVVPFDRRLIMDVHVPAGQARGARAGDMVVVDITRWPSATRGPIGAVVEVLGPIDTPGIDVQIIMRKYDIVDEHNAASVAEARRLGSGVRQGDLEGRTDFRALPTVTIDGEQARDFDDAITIERLENGHYWLGVHIADVSHYVREGSALDEEAYDRGTSVYFPERAVHMFPAELATGLCSLNPHVDRLVQSCLMEVDRRGDVVRYEFHDGVINSDARMTYTTVNAILTDHEPEMRARYEHLVPMFELMHELFEVLNLRRRRRGSVDFDLQEPEVVLDAEGLVERIGRAERNVAHRLIEEFMLLANETVGRHLESRGDPGLFRIHEAPDPVKVAAFEDFVTALGYGLSAPAGTLHPRHFQRLVESVRNKPEEKPVALLMLRTMQRARYDAVNRGHFGLAAPAYVHFTSPIRRYPDLVIHRLLRASRGGMAAGQRSELARDLPETARHTSERERRANEAEWELIAWKKVRFMADRVGEEFAGFVTGVTAFGLFVELVEHFVEGLVHISTMADDYYRFVDRQHMLRGEHAGRTYRLGDEVKVQVLRVDLEQRQVALGIVEILEAVRELAHQRRPKRRLVKPKAEARRIPRRRARGDDRRKRKGSR
jgi:ribonuclease R